MKAVDQLRAFEAQLAARGLSWALHFAPRHLRQARSPDHPRGAALQQLLPADYRAFVESVGYPVIGLAYRDPEGISFLPPEPMAVLSCTLPRFDRSLQEFVFPPKTSAERTRCFLAFFASYDLGKVHGYAFGPSPSGTDLVVWCIEDGKPVQACGSFSEWCEQTISALSERVANLTDAEVAGLTAAHARNDASDPHRLLHYALAGSYDLAPYTSADLALSWIEDGSDVPFGYGLIDASGRMLLPITQAYKRVRPFRAGVAEVILNVPGATYAGPWTKIRVDGSPV